VPSQLSFFVKSSGPKDNRIFVFDIWQYLFEVRVKFTFTRNLLNLYAYANLKHTFLQLISHEIY